MKFYVKESRCGDYADRQGECKGRVDDVNGVDWRC